MPHVQDFDALVAAACLVPLKGWDFSFLAGRAVSEPLPWNYLKMAGDAVNRSTRALDVDTGGGELFATLSPPPGSIAVEPHAPNVSVAATALAPLGVDVRERRSSRLPLADGGVDLVLNRHGAFDTRETYRVLQPGGVLLTQQVGSRNDVEFNPALDVSPPQDTTALKSAHQARDTLTSAGFTVTRIDEAWPRTRFLDVGAVVLQLRAVPWQVPGFDVAQHRDQLRTIHDQILQHGSFDVTSHRLLLAATR